MTRTQCLAESLLPRGRLLALEACNKRALAAVPNLCAPLSHYSRTLSSSSSSQQRTVATSSSLDVLSTSIIG